MKVTFWNKEQKVNERAIFKWTRCEWTGYFLNELEEECESFIRKTHMLWSCFWILEI